MKVVKAIGIVEAGAISNLHIVEIPAPVLKPRDILVKVKAVSLNPIDSKKRTGGSDKLSKLNPLVLGYAASGVVEAVGPEVKFFKKGDEVIYAGDLTKNGSNADFQLVDERHKK